MQPIIVTTLTFQSLSETFIGGRNWCQILPGFLHWPWIQSQPWKVLKFHKLKMSLNCFGKRVEGLEKFGICLCETFNKTWWLWELPATVAIKRVEELLRPLIINKCHARMLQIGVFFLTSTSRVVCCRMIDWKKTLNWPSIIEWKGLEKPWIF